MIPPNFRQVSPKLYRSAAPTNQAQVDWLVNNYPKIRKVISLDRDAGLFIARLLPPSVKHIQLHINPESSASINAAGNKLKAGGGAIFDTPQGSTLIHCRRGKDRTGFAVGIYNVLKQGASPAFAVRQAESLGYGSGISAESKALMNKHIGLTPTTPTTPDQAVLDISEADDIVTYLREEGSGGYQQRSSNVAGTSNPIMDQTDVWWSAVRSPEGEQNPSVNIRARIEKLKDIVKQAGAKTAVVIKATPHPAADQFYSDLKKLLMSIGYVVDMVNYGDLPPVADFWIGHGRGGQALKFAPSTVQQLILSPTLRLSPDIINAIKVLDSKTDVNEAFGGGGPVGSPTAEELPSGQGSPAIPSAPQLPSTGLRSNYQGSIPGTNFGVGGGTPGSGTGGIIDIDPYGLVQL